MSIIGRRCHELKVQDQGHWWRIFYRIDPDAIVIADVMPKKTNATSKSVIDTCKARYGRYDQTIREAEKAQAKGKNKGR
jgi:phage-related protein